MICSAAVALVSSMGLELLREVVRMVLAEGPGSTWYHGSPYAFDSMSQFEQPLMFVTDSKHVASEYTKELIGSGNRPANGSKQEQEPSLYEVGLLFGDDRILDTRKPDHKELFAALAKESRRRFDDDGFSRKDMMHVPAAPGSRIAGEFPSFGLAITLLELLRDHAMVAAFVGEGSQGASLAIRDPQRNVEILSRTPMSG